MNTARNTRYFPATGCYLLVSTNLIILWLLVSQDGDFVRIEKKRGILRQKINSPRYIRSHTDLKLFSVIVALQSRID